MGITFTNKKSTKDSDGDLKNAGVDSDAEKELATGTGGKARNDLMPKFSLETKLVSTLATALNPVRKPSKGQIAKVVRSIRAFGFRDPPMIGKDGEIIDGQIRVEAAKSLGLKEIPCIVFDDLSETEIRLLRLALNRIQERGEWDELALKFEMAYLLEFEPDLTVTGFEVAEIDQLLILDEGGIAEADPLDEQVGLPSPDELAVTRPGDLFHLNEHRILCGNARNLEDVAKVVADRELSAVFTDPPYNLSIKKDITVGAGKFAEFAEGSGEMSNTGYEKFLKVPPVTWLRL